MFCYYDARFAHDMALVFHSANVAQRHAVNSAVAVKVQSRPDAFAEFNACVNDNNFLRMLCSSVMVPAYQRFSFFQKVATVSPTEATATITTKAKRIQEVRRP